MTTGANPLLDSRLPIPFDQITADHIVPAVTEALARAQPRIDELGAGHGGSYDQVVGNLDDVTGMVERVWAPISHLNNVASTPELRLAYAEALPEITRFWNRLHHHAGLYGRLREFAGAPQGRALTGLRKRHVELVLREFRRAGADLGPGKKQTLERLQVELSELGRRFEENVLDDTAAFKKLVRDRNVLVGLPDTVQERAAQLAADQDQEGWLLTLDMPCVQAVLQHAENRDLRREIHAAYLDRCTLGDRANAPIIDRILDIRRRLASILGYADFSDYRLETLMAGSGARVRGFLDALIDATRRFHERDATDLQANADRSRLGSLEPWDVSWLMEKLRTERFDVDDEQLRPWFPLDEVQAGLFEIARGLFGLRIARTDNAGVWHPEVEYFEVRDETGVHLGSFYTDWFPRDTKRQGAWMDNLVAGGPLANGEFRPHVAFIGGNFSPPTASRPALLTHREVCTLFHEFGHLLHHVCSRVAIPARGGVNVAWDWVEVPSQIMENWCWQREALDLFARHHATGETLPDALLERLLAARRHMGGWLQMRQLSFANLDLALHRRYRGEVPVMDYAAAALRPFVPSRRFVERHILPSFAHLFAGGYASAYYSYLWSETLEADAFSRFEREGVLNPKVGRDFRDIVLARGDSRPAIDLFREFMGRDPDPDALVRRNLGDPDALDD